MQTPGPLIRSEQKQFGEFPVLFRLKAGKLFELVIVIQVATASASVKFVILVNYLTLVLLHLCADS